MKKSLFFLVPFVGASLLQAQNNYCDVSINSPTNSFYIDEVNLLDIKNKSGKNTTQTYSDFTAISTNAPIGKSVEMSIKPFNSYLDTNNATFKGVLIAWIDYDQNGTFETSEQILIDPVNMGTSYKKSIDIPATAKLGQTRMRIKYRWDFWAEPLNPCEKVDLGEVEDYSINLVNDLSVNDNSLSKNKLSLYPNPTQDFIRISNITEGSYKIFSTNGSQVLKGNILNQKIDVRQLSKGVYIIELETKGEKKSSKFIKK